MAKAESNGVYRLGESQFRIRKGDTIPEGAEFTAHVDATDEVVEERAEKAAPENRAKKAAPENR